MIEIGAGAGQNVAHLPPKVTRYIALEPSEMFMRRLHRRLEQNNGTFERLALQAKAEAIPHRSEVFDTVLSFLVLCSANDPLAALTEVYRVLKPGGRLLFFEHVLAEQPSTARKQFIFNPLWKRIACGCELVRDTLRTIECAGFEETHLRSDRSRRWALCSGSGPDPGIRSRGSRPSVSVPPTTRRKGERRCLRSPSRNSR